MSSHPASFLVDAVLSNHRGEQYVNVLRKFSRLGESNRYYVSCGSQHKQRAESDVKLSSVLPYGQSWSYTPTSRKNEIQITTVCKVNYIKQSQRLKSRIFDVARHPGFAITFLSAFVCTEAVVCKQTAPPHENSRPTIMTPSCRHSQFELLCCRCTHPRTTPGKPASSKPVGWEGRDSRHGHRRQCSEMRAPLRPPWRQPWKTPTWLCSSQTV